MIVKMKKVFLVTTGSTREACLRVLRKLGIVHVESVVREHESLAALQAERQELSLALQYLSQYPEERAPGTDGVKNAGAPEGDTRAQAKAAASGVLELVARKNSLEEEGRRLKSECERVAPWGSFDPAAFFFLAEKGIRLALYRLPAGKLAAFAAENDYFLLEMKKKQARLLVTGDCDSRWQDYLVPLPPRSLGSLEEALAGGAQEQERLSAQIAGYTVHKPLLKAALARVDKALEFQGVGLAMPQQETLTYLSGFLPHDQVDALKKTAAAEGWGLLITDPAEDDNVPTLIRNPAWLRIIEPVFSFLGITPGYRELDISMWFLFFLGIFYAMIIGDGGYGLLMFLMTFLVHRLVRKVPRPLIFLLYSMSLCTIIWGALSGTWFGFEGFARVPFLEGLILPWIASFPVPGSQIDTREFIWNFCFLIGLTHLSIARLTAFIRKLPRWSAYADLGWLIMLWGNYFLIRTLLLQKPLFALSPWLLGIGFALFALFSEMSGSLWKGLGKGLAFAPLKLLNAVSGFADIVSYIRLYAVGLASVEVARAFNNMALTVGFGSIVSGAGAVLILLAGHSLNIVMCIMSVVVHGVRLNVLEFSGHLGIEWAGHEYKPFKEQE